MIRKASLREDCPKSGPRAFCPFASARARPAWDRETAEALGLALTAQTEVPEAEDRPAGFVLRFEKRREEYIKEETR